MSLLIVFFYWFYKRLTRKTAIDTAIKQLTVIKECSSLDNEMKLRQLSILIRRVAISLIQRQEVASLTGQQWLAFLDSSLIGEPFSSGCGQLLADAPYKNTQPTNLEITQLISLCEDWLKVQTKFTKRKLKS
jgi:hypothetical protein